MKLFLVVSLAGALTYLSVLALVAILAALKAGGRREEHDDSHEALSASRFTIPVSVIMPISSDDAASLSATIQALLGLQYPEFEVVVVADAANDAPLDTLTRHWLLEAREFFYRRTLATADVRRIYRSNRDPRLILIEKAPAGRADALNSGIDVARYRFALTLEAGITFSPDALLRIMGAALRDPANVVGASSHVESGVGATFQRLASARSVMDSRLVWRQLASGLGPSGAVVWRRDSVIALQGFSSSAADPELDMMFRLQTAGSGGLGRFERGADVFGQVAPLPLTHTLGRTVRRQLTALEILWAVLSGRAAKLARRTRTYLIVSELVTPIALIWVILGTVIGAVAGWFGWGSAGLAVVVLSFGQAAVSAAALLMRGATGGAPAGTELLRLLLAAPLEVVVHKPAVAAVRLSGACRFLFSKSPRTTA